MKRHDKLSFAIFTSFITLVKEDTIAIRAVARPNATFMMESKPQISCN